MSRPRMQIPVHIFVFSIGALPACLYGFYHYSYRRSDTEFNEVLQKDYSNNIEASKAKRAQMVKFVESIKRGQKDDDQRMKEILRGGKGDIKRHYAVDERYYGTEEGVLAKERAEKELHQQELNKKKLKATKAGAIEESQLASLSESVPPKRKAVNSSSKTTTSAIADAVVVQPHEETVNTIPNTVKSAIAVAVVGTAAAVALLFGGGRSR